MLFPTMGRERWNTIVEEEVNKNGGFFCLDTFDPQIDDMRFRKTLNATMRRSKGARRFLTSPYPPASVTALCRSASQ